MAREYACRQCKTLVAGKVCPMCNSTDLTPDWSGLLIILDVGRSQIAKTLNITQPGRYALRVS